MPHTTRLLALQRRRLAGYREQHVASCELETCGARGDRRLHSRRESAIVVRGSAGSLPPVVDSLPTTFFPTSCRKAEAGTLSSTPTPPETIDEQLFKGMQWRQIGPFRGGRALTIEGVPGEPDTYYFGAVAGGVWKTIDGGANWTPLFDKEPDRKSTR